MWSAGEGAESWTRLAGGLSEGLAPRLGGREQGGSSRRPAWLGVAGRAGCGGWLRGVLGEL